MFSQLITRTMAQYQPVMRDHPTHCTFFFFFLSFHFCGIKFPAAVMEISFVLNLTVNQCDEDEQRVFVRWRFAAFFSSLQPRALRIVRCKCHRDSWMARVPAAVDQLYNVRVSLVICTSWTKVGLSQIALHLWTGGSSLKYLLQLEGPRTILCASEKGRKTKALSEAS